MSLFSSFRLVPLQRPPHSFLESELWGVTQTTDGRSRVALGMSDIPGAPGIVLLQNQDALQALKQGPRLVQGDPPAVAAVEEPARYAFCERGLQVQIGDILHIGEIARLLAVSEHRGSAPLDHGPHKERQHARILARRILPRAGDVEVS